MLDAIDQFTKGTTAIMHQVALLRTEVSSLRKANEGLSKRRRAKKTRIRLKGSLTVQDAEDLLDQKAIDEQVAQETKQSSSRIRAGRTKTRSCGACGKPGHDVRTCQEVAESPDSTILDTIIVN